MTRVVTYIKLYGAMTETPKKYPVQDYRNRDNITYYYVYGTPKVKVTPGRLSTGCSHTHMLLYFLLQFILLCSHHFAQNSSLLHKHKSGHSLHSPILSNSLQNKLFMISL